MILSGTIDGIPVSLEWALPDRLLDITPLLLAFVRPLIDGEAEVALTPEGPFLLAGWDSAETTMATIMSVVDQADVEVTGQEIVAPSDSGEKD